VQGLLIIFLRIANLGPEQESSQETHGFSTLSQLGRLPIEIAAVHAETEVVELLFPVTRRAPKVPDWTVGGIVSYVNSAAYKKWVCHIFILLLSRYTI
jgi:hypothetical protein